MAQLGLALLEAQLAVPEDWSGDLKAFLKKSLGRWINTLGGVDIRRRIGMQAIWTSQPNTELMFDQDGDPWAHPDDDAPVDVLALNAMEPRLYLVIEQIPGEHQILEMGRVVAEMEKTDVRLPSIFWSRFRTGFGHLEIWDFERALDQEEMGYWDDWEDLEEGDDDPRPSKCVPHSLRLPRIDDEKARSILREKGVIRGSWAGELLWGALDLAEAGRGVTCGWEELTLAEKDQFSENMGRWPSVAMVINPMEGDRWSGAGTWDALAHLWDAENDAMWNAGGPCDPICVWPFQVSVAGLNDLFERLRRFCELHRRGNWLMDLLTVPEPGQVPLGLQLSNPFVAGFDEEPATRLLSDEELVRRGFAEIEALQSIGEGVNT